MGLVLWLAPNEMFTYMNRGVLVPGAVALATLVAISWWRTEEGDRAETQAYVAKCDAIIESGYANARKKWSLQGKSKARADAFLAAQRLPANGANSTAVELYRELCQSAIDWESVAPKEWHYGVYAIGGAVGVTIDFFGGMGMGTAGMTTLMGVDMGNRITKYHDFNSSVARLAAYCHAEGYDSKWCRRE